jgi:hypothetical protein
MSSEHAAMAVLQPLFCGVLTYVIGALRERRQRRIALGIPSLAYRFGRFCARLIWSMRH